MRDLLLGADGLDLDVVVEGDARKAARGLAADLGGDGQDARPLPDRDHIGGSGCGPTSPRARRERYVRPGALPTVQAADLDADLVRRDFTVNAMAASLDPEGFGEVIDPHGGRADLDAGLIRVLHERSFVDDATRILRACRYAARFGFNLEAETERLAREAAGRFSCHQRGAASATNSNVRWRSGGPGAGVSRSRNGLGRSARFSPASGWVRPRPTRSTRPTVGHWASPFSALRFPGKRPRRWESVWPRRSLCAGP